MSEDVKLDGSLLENSLGYNDGLVLGCNDVIKLGLSDGEVTVNTLRDAETIKLGDDEGS